jgi:hypothetical protein
MKRLVVATAALILVLVAIAACGCTEQEPAAPPVEGELVASSCVSCHSDKDLLKEIASPEEEEESEATTGEG